MVRSSVVVETSSVFSVTSAVEQLNRNIAEVKTAAIIQKCCLLRQVEGNLWLKNLEDAYATKVASTIETPAKSDRNRMITPVLGL